MSKVDEFAAVMRADVKSQFSDGRPVTMASLKEAFIDSARSLAPPCDVDVRRDANDHNLIHITVPPDLRALRTLPKR